MQKVPRGCSVKNCETQHYSLGYCRYHYRRSKAHGDPVPRLAPDSAAERWLPVVGHETDYEVSNLGRVRRIGRGQGATVGRVLCAHLPPEGYPKTALRRGAKRRMHWVHRLVAEAFLGPSRGRIVNHKNFDKSDNRVQNLEWVTHRENVLHAFAADRRDDAVGMRSGAAKLDDDAVRFIRRAYPRLNGVELAQRFGVNSTTIYQVLRGRTWKHVP